MTGDDLAREVQARCDARVAEAVAAERQRIAAALTRWLEISRGSWPHDGRIAWAEVARWVRWIADCGPAFEREASFDRHVGDGDGRKPVDAYPTDQTGASNALRAPQGVSTEGDPR